MQVDWLTVAAQIVNFLVLVWLLQRFLYRPIVNAMRRREQGIEERLAEAKAVRAEAEHEAQLFREKQQELEAARQGILDEARRQAGELGERLEAELSEEMEERRETWRRHLAEEREEFAQSLRRQAGHQLLQVTARILADYADSDMADRAAGIFVERLKGLDENVREKLAAAARRSAEPALVETGSALASAGKRQVTHAIHECLSTEIEVRYAEDRDIVLGLRLTVGEQSVEWSAARYLRRVGAELDEILEAGILPPGERSPGGKDEPRETA